jgi:hypothetical protein
MMAEIIGFANMNVYPVTLRETDAKELKGNPKSNRRSKATTIFGLNNHLNAIVPDLSK